MALIIYTIICMIIILALVFMCIDMLTNFLLSQILSDMFMCLKNIKHFKIERYNNLTDRIGRLDLRSYGGVQSNYRMVGWVFFNWFIGCKWVIPVKWREWVETEPGTGRRIQYRESGDTSISYYLD